MPLYPMLFYCDQEGSPAVVYGHGDWCSWSLRIWF